MNVLMPVERPRMDAGLLERLCTDLGPYGAEDVVCRAMEELGQCLFAIQEASFSGTIEERHKLLSELAGMADAIGLCGLSQVARDVMTAIEQSDAVAEAATMARLARNGERSLAALWDLQDLSI